jgi:hypothetical protein
MQATKSVDKFVKNPAHKCRQGARAVAFDTVMIN